jgi:hypothetical protein
MASSGSPVSVGAADMDEVRCRRQRTIQISTTLVSIEHNNVQAGGPQAFGFLRRSGRDRQAFELSAKAAWIASEV